MFEFGFTEIIVAAVIGLIVIGPERLPRVARTIGRLFSRLRSYATDLKYEINRQAELDEFNEIRASVEKAAKNIEDGVSQKVNIIGDEFDSITKSGELHKSEEKDESGRNPLMPKPLKDKSGSIESKGEGNTVDTGRSSGGTGKEANSSSPSPTEESK